MADKPDIWQEWTEKAVRHALGEKKSKPNRRREEKINLWQEWFGQLPNAIEFLWRKWFRK